MIVVATKMMWRLVSVLVILTAFGNCDPLIDQTFSDQEAELSSYLEKIENIQKIPIVGDYVVLEKSANLKNEETRDVRNQNNFLERCARFLANRELQIKFPESEARDFLTGKFCQSYSLVNFKYSYNQ